MPKADDNEIDDFDIVQDDEGEPGLSRATWVYIIVISVVAIFAFGVGAAFMLLSDRLGPATPAATVTVTPVAGVISPTQVALITATAMITVASTPTPTITATATPSATATLAPTPTPSCTQQVEEAFVPLYSQAELGCAQSNGNVVWAAWQSFERGSMLWRSDTDTSYVFYGIGAWFPIAEGWDGAPPADRGAPPPNLRAPERGFGYVWGLRDDIFAGLGWATDQERGFCALVQEFENGFMLRSSDVASCTAENLYNHAATGELQPILFAANDNGQWRSVPATNAPTPAVPAPDAPVATGGEQPADTLVRPANQGIYAVPRLEGITLDGNFSDWPEDWFPINTLIFGSEQHDGPPDLSANFQLGWNANGLLLAVRVNDDRYRPGPNGSDLWQGDSLEIQFDRLLAEDFTTTQADDDDYQAGIAFDDQLTALRGYLWLNFARETALNYHGTVLRNDRGYQLELIVPWYVFDMEPEDVATNRAYGFNLSVNDNDSDSPAQQSVISASPARVAHDNPVEWGTLQLIP